MCNTMAKYMLFHTLVSDPLVREQPTTTANSFSSTNLYCGYEGSTPTDDPTARVVCIFD